MLNFALAILIKVIQYSYWVSNWVKFKRILDAQLVPEQLIKPDYVLLQCTPSAANEVLVLIHTFV